MPDAPSVYYRGGISRDNINFANEIFDIYHDESEG